jgi:hypothetical protein
MPRQIAADDPYRNSLLKLIPSEIVATYMSIEGVIPNSGNMLNVGASIAATLLIAGLIYPYLQRVHNVTDKRQIVLTVVGFLIWVLWLQIDNPNRWLGGSEIFKDASWLPSVLLMLWTFASPLLMTPAQKKRDS